MTSPLVGTAGVISALCLISIPLRQLTSAPPASVAPQRNVETTETKVPAVVRLKLLDPATHLLLETADGGKLMELRDLKSGVSEHDVEIQMTANKVNLLLKADFGEHSEETAVFVTLMPAGQNDQTRYSTGKGMFHEMLIFDWNR